MVQKYIQEFLDFLNRINKDITQRNGDQETREMRKYLMELINYLTQCITSNKFNLEKFKAICVLCRGELLTLIAGGYVWDPEIERGEILKKFDGYNLHIVHIIEHVGESLDSSSTKLIIKEPLPNTEMPCGDYCAKRFSAKAKVIGPLKDIDFLLDKKYREEYIFSWYVVPENSGIPDRNYTDGLGIDAQVTVPIELLPTPNNNFATIPVTLIVVMRHAIDFMEGNQTFIAKASVNLKMGYGYSRGYLSRYHIPNTEVMTREEEKLVAVANRWYGDKAQNKNYFYYMAKKMHIKLLFKRESQSTNNLGLIQGVSFTPTDTNNPHWVLLQQQESDLFFAVPLESSKLILNNFFEGFVFEEYRDAEDGISIFYRAAHIKIESYPQNKCNVVFKGYLLLHGHEKCPFALPKTYEELVAKEPLIEEPSITMRAHKSEVYPDDEIVVDVVFNNAEFAVKNKCRLIEAIRHNGEEWQETRIIKEWEHQIEHLELKFKAKDVGLGGHFFIFMLINFFGDGKHLQSNIISVKVARVPIQITIRSSKDDNVYYMNEEIWLTASFPRIPQLQKGIGYEWKDASGSVINKGTTNKNTLEWGIPAGEARAGKHSFALTLIGAYAEGEHASSAPLEIEVIGGQSIELRITNISPKTEGQAYQFYPNERVLLRATIKNFAIIKNAYEWCLIVNDKGAYGQEALEKQEIDTSISENRLDVGSHTIKIAVFNRNAQRGQPPVITSNIIHVKIIKKGWFNR